MTEERKGKTLDLKTATEEELAEAMREHWALNSQLSPKNGLELQQIINDLKSREQTYGTCVYAMALSAIATFNYMAHELGCTGYQAGCADLLFLKHTRKIEHGFRIVNYDYLLYPQYYHSPDHFPTAKQALMENLEMVQKAVREKIKEDNAGGQPQAHPDVRQHWEWILSLVGDNHEGQR